MVHEIDRAQSNINSKEKMAEQEWRKAKKIQLKDKSIHRKQDEATRNDINLSDRRPPE
tara:strand:+ start:4609 stop:4782 length:174 start_codon:yes stop_codon:yes gene_type:complete